MVETVWGIHMPDHAGIDALSNSLVSIGWPEMGDLTQLPSDREAIKDALARTYPDKKAGAIPGNAGVIYRFVHEVAEGDWVVFPSKHDRMINIGRFTGEIGYRPDAEALLSEYATFRKVEWLAHLPRTEFKQSTLYELGSFITLFKIKNHAADLLSRVGVASAPVSSAPESEQEEPDDDTVSSQVSAHAEEATDDFIIKRLYDALSGHAFEEFTAHLLECMGYNARVTQKSADGGIDVIAHKDKLGLEPPIIKVQCKSTTGRVNEKEIRELLGTLADGEFGLIVTLGSFAREAKMAEKTMTKLRLIDGEELVKLVLKHYDDLAPRFRSVIPLKQIYVPDLAN